MIARPSRIASLILAGTWIAACGTSAPPPADAPSAASPSATSPPAASAPTPKSDLVGTSWQLVRFTGSDKSTLQPDDRSQYTITFQADGSVVARIDCNRGHGAWKSAGSGELVFGPLALTRMMCPQGSMHDRVAADWGAVRSYTIKDGHLFLSLMADGGVYEYEPASPAPG